MIIFNELKISPDRDKIIIDIEIPNQAYFTNVFLDTITIDTQKTFIENGPSTTPIFTKSIEEIMQNQNIKKASFEINSADLGVTLSDNLFFIYIKTKGSFAPDTPPTQSNNTTIGVVYDGYNIYKKFMELTHELMDCCSENKNFINIILEQKALDMAIQTGYYSDAIKYWNKFFKDEATLNTNTNCNCNNGKY